MPGGVQPQHAQGANANPRSKILIILLLHLSRSDQQFCVVFYGILLVKSLQTPMNTRIILIYTDFNTNLIVILFNFSFYFFIRVNPCNPCLNILNW